MKNSVILLVWFLLFSAVSKSQQNVPIPITVGPNPTFIDGYFSFTQNDYKLFITTLGFDQNYNGIEEEGDVKPGIYQISFNQIISGNLNATLVKELEFASLPFPTRIYVDKIGNFVLVPNKFSILKVNLESGDIINTLNPLENFQLPEDSYISSIYYHNGHIFIGVNSLSVHSFFIVNESNLNVMFETACEQNPLQSVVVGNYLFILLEGIFGQNNSKLWVYEIRSFDPFEIVFVKEIDLGDTGNHIAKVGNDKLLITMNGSHQVHIFNIPNLEIEKTIQLPTSEYDGPRESGITGENTIVTTAFDGNLYYYDLNGNSLGKINIGNKLEGLFTYTFQNPNMNLSVVATSSPFLPNYQPNNKVYLIINSINSAEDNFVNNLNFYPNPTKDFINITLRRGIEFPTRVEIFDVFGNKLKEFNFQFVGEKILIPTYDLPNGLYYAKINTDKTIETISFLVNR